jgi:hypothetical protein
MPAQLKEWLRETIVATHPPKVVAQKPQELLVLSAVSIPHCLKNNIT